jgi:hypothetical protein
MSIDQTTTATTTDIDTERPAHPRRGGLAIALGMIMLLTLMVYLNMG